MAMVGMFRVARMWEPIPVHWRFGIEWRLYWSRFRLNDWKGYRC